MVRTGVYMLASKGQYRMSKPKRSTQSPMLYMIIIITSELIYNKTSNNRVQTCENWGIELHGSGIKGCNLLDQGRLAMKICKRRRRLKERKLEEIKMDGSSGLVKRRPTNKIYKRSSTPQSHPFTMSQSNCPFSLFPIPFKTIQSSHFFFFVIFASSSLEVGGALGAAVGVEQKTSVRRLRCVVVR